MSASTRVYLRSATRNGTCRSTDTNDITATFASLLRRLDHLLLDHLLGPTRLDYRDEVFPLLRRALLAQSGAVTFKVDDGQVDVGDLRNEQPALIAGNCRLVVRGLNTVALGGNTDW